MLFDCYCLDYCHEISYLSIHQIIIYIHIYCSFILSLSLFYLFSIYLTIFLTRFLSRETLESDGYDKIDEFDEPDPHRNKVDNLIFDIFCLESKSNFFI